MSSINRTANCKNCGSVNLRIIPKVGEIDYLCSDCGKFIETVEYEKYITVNPICHKCNSEIFKATITNEDETEHWSVNCSECNEEPEEVFVDKRGKVIDQNIREILIIQDSIEALSNKFAELEKEFDSLENTVNFVSNDVSSLEGENYSIKSDITSCENNISELERKVNDFE